MPTDPDPYAEIRPLLAQIRQLVDDLDGLIDQPKAEEADERHD